MKITRLLEVLQSLNEYDPGNLGGRPDTSGMRGKGLDRKPAGRGGVYPYDRDVSYGQTANYDRGSISTGHFSSTPTPRDTDGFSLSILGQDTEDLDSFLGKDQEEFEEAIGTPMNFGISGKNGQMDGMSGGGGFGKNPARSWEKSPLDDSLLNTLAIDTRTPDIEEVPIPGTPNFHMNTDDDMERRLDRIWGRDDNLNFVEQDPFVNPDLFGQPDSHVIAPDPWSVINTRLSSRGLYGMMPKESAWDRMTGMRLNNRERD